MTKKDGLQVSLKLSAKEQEIVRELAGGFIEFDKMGFGDKRDDVIREVVVHRYGSYDRSRERMVAKPAWDKVFSLRACPNCNPLAQNTGRLMPAGDILECRVCCLKLTNQLFESARKSQENEKKWLEKQEKLNEKIKKQGLKDEQLEKLIAMAEDRADAEMRKLEQANAMESAQSEKPLGGGGDETP